MKESAIGEGKQANMPSRLPNIVAYPTILIGSAAYFFNAMSGSNSMRFFLGEAANASGVKIGLSVWAAVSYLPFSYETFTGKLLLKPVNAFGWLSSILSVLASASFYTSAYAGSVLLSSSQELAISIGLIMFLYRSSYAINSANLFADRLIKVLLDIESSIREKSFVKGLMALLCIITVLGYAVGTTDTSCAAFKDLFKLVLNDVASTRIGQTLSVFAAVGTLPFTLHATHRGLCHYVLTDSQEVPPRDRYTWLATLLVLPLVLGVMGSAMMENGDMFSCLGSWTNISSLICSSIFAICATAPSAAQGLRAVNYSAVFYRCSRQSKQVTTYEAFKEQPYSINQAHETTHLLSRVLEA
ncbi:MAG: hypothetical protein K0S29_616 [Gammaproteobacteria bacterium]|nr:hypothetical protein [Gammaproteobacteria bacterium]